MKDRKCKECKKTFTPIRAMQPTCFEMQCQIDYANRTLNKNKQLKQKENRKALKQFNNSDLNVMKRKAQKIFNKYIRLRDKGKPCVSCGCFVPDGKGHASHFKPATNSKLRFDERNVHLSCVKCNVFLSGNLVPYRAALIKLIGIDEVEDLEATTAPYRYTIDELKEIIETYKLKIKELD